MKPCPKCETMREVKLVTYDEQVTIKGHEVTFTAESYRCQVCQEDFDTAETLNRNIASALNQYSAWKRGK